MIVLAFDTTSEHGGAALYRDHECLASAANEGPANLYSVALFQLVDRVLKQTDLELRDIELFAAANGPGSFTGIRVGLAAAQAWAKAFERPARGVSVLEALVEAAQPETDCAVPLLDARRGEFFLGVFRRSPQSSVGKQSFFVPDGEGSILKPDSLAPFLAELSGAERAKASVTCVIRQHDHLAQALRQSLPQPLRWQSVSGPLLGAIARLALRAYHQGKATSPEELDAYYIRRLDAELKWKE